MALATFKVAFVTFKVPFDTFKVIANLPAQSTDPHLYDKFVSVLELCAVPYTFTTGMKSSSNLKSVTK